MQQDNNPVYLTSRKYSEEPEYDEESINWRKWFYLVFSNWKWFVLSLVIALGVSWWVYRAATRIFEVQSTVMLNTRQSQQNILAENFMQSVPGVARDNREFVNQSILLKLNSRILKTLENLDFNVHMYSKGTFNYSDLYPNFLYQVELDRAHPQAIGAEYRLTTDKKGKLIVRVKGKDAVIHDFLSGKDMERVGDLDLSLPVQPDGTVRHDYCAFRIRANQVSLKEAAANDDVYFNIINNQRLVKEYSEMEITEAAKNATVVNITLRAKSPAKARDFLNKHMEMWLQDDLEKKNLTAVNTIRFIDEQLGMMRDTLDRMSRRSKVSG